MYCCAFKHNFHHKSNKLLLSLLLKFVGQIHYVVLVSFTLLYDFQIMYLYYLLGWKGYIVKNPQKIQVR